MYTRPLATVLVALTLSACEQKAAPNIVKFPKIEATAKDVSQSENIRESAGVFLKILSGQQGITSKNLTIAHQRMVRSRNTTTILTYVEFLKELEKKLPSTLPPAETYLSFKDEAGQATIVEYNVAQTVIMMSNCIENISLYGDPSADSEIEGVLKRLKEKHGTSETGKRILEFLNMVRGQGLEDRARGIKPWESPEPGSSS